MENNLSKQENTHSKGRDSTQSDGIVLEKKDGNILMGSAASYVSRTVTPFETDIGRETVLQNQKENFQRTFKIFFLFCPCTFLKGMSR
jgi:hypothetical protein